MTQQLSGQNIQSAAIELYSYRFVEAEKQLHALHSQPTTPPSDRNLLQLQYYWWQYLSGNEQNAYLDSCIQLATRFRKTAFVANDEEVFRAALAYSFLLRVYLIRKQYLAAISTLDHAMPYYRYALQAGPRHQGLMLISGLYNYLINKTTDSNPIFRPYLLIYPGGSTTEGLKSLNTCTQSQHPIIKTEALYFLTKIYAEIEKNATIAESYSQRLVACYPHNLVFRFEHYKILKQQNAHPKAETEKQCMLQEMLLNNEMNAAQKTHFLPFLQVNLR